MIMNKPQDRTAPPPKQHPYYDIIQKVCAEIAQTPEKDPCTVCAKYRYCDHDGYQCQILG
jgi:hypothetical protein